MLGVIIIGGLASPARSADVTDQRLLNAAIDPDNWMMAAHDYASTPYSQKIQTIAKPEVIRRQGSLRAVLRYPP